MRKLTLTVITLIVVISFSINCTKEKDVLAEIEGKKITLVDFLKYYENSTTDVPPENFPPMNNLEDAKNFLKIILTKDAMVLYAKEKNLLEDERFQEMYEKNKTEYMLEKLKKEITKNIKVSESEMLDFYKNMDKTYYFWTIQCMTKEKAEKAKNALDRGEDFFEVAKRYDDRKVWEKEKTPPPSKLGYNIFDIYQNIFELDKNEYSDVIYFPDGETYMIAYIKDITVDEIQPYEEMKKAIKDYLISAKTTQEKARYRVELYNSYEPVFNQKALEVFKKGDVEDFNKAIKEDMVIADCGIFEYKFSDIYDEEVEKDYILNINRGRNKYYWGMRKEIRGYIIEKMMLWAAQERGLDKSEEVIEKLTNFKEEYAIDRLYENEFMSNLPTPTAEEIQNYYNEHKEEFYSPDIADVRIILTETIDESLEAKKFIEDGGDPLEAVYKFSLNKSFGGFYNISTNSQARPELKEMVLQMEPGEITDPVESKVQSGYEIAYVIDRQYEHYKTLEDPEVRSEVIRNIWASEENINELDLLSKKWMDDILSKYSYSIFEEKLDIALKEARKIKDKKEREYLQKEIIK